MTVDKGEAGVSIIKSLLSAVPYVGTALDEVFFEYRGRIKQKRIEKFIEIFAELVGSIKQEQFNLDSIKSEDFSDFFEALLIQVSKTSSEKKLERFKQLLLKELIDPSPVDYAELYLQILSGLHEKQIIMLSDYDDVRGSEYNSAVGERNITEAEVTRIEKQLEIAYRAVTDTTPAEEDQNIQNLLGLKQDMERRFKWLDEKVSDLSVEYASVEYGMDTEERMYFIQDLCSKGLLRDIGMEYPGTASGVLVEITQLGSDLVKRIQDQ